ncbi:MAG: PEP/pyruvate-binding domain-containing protein [Desulfuromonadales bacterium]
MAKFVYFFGDGEAEGRGDMKNLLGGKGANLAEMTSIGLPVPAGFTISTEVCTEFYKNDRNYPAGLEEEVNQHLAKVEQLMDKKFGDSQNPLLVSVRSGARASMPGMDRPERRSPLCLRLLPAIHPDVLQRGSRSGR